LPVRLSTKDYNKALTKLERPPQAFNFVRYIHTDIETMTKALVEFALNFPFYTYRAGNTVVRDCINLSIDDQTALTAVSTRGAANSREINKEYVSAFLANRDKLKLLGIPTFDQFTTPYPVSASIQIPVKPLTVCLEGHKLRAIFSVGWASIPFDEFQWKLLLTIMEDAVFSLEDLKDAAGEFHAFPREKKNKPGNRKSLLVQRGDFELLSQSDLREIMDNYLTALEKAKAILASYVTVETDPSEHIIGVTRLPLFPELGP
jgi:hypothetical protein